MCRHRLSSSVTPGSVNSHRGEVHGARGEHARAGGRLVVRHLGGRSGPEQVGDPREHLRPRRRLRGGRVDLDPEAADLLAEHAPLTRPVPSNSHGAASTARRERPLARPVVVRAVLDAEESRLGPAEVRHCAIRRIAFGLRSTFQKKLFAERRISRPPRSR